MRTALFLECQGHRRGVVLGVGKGDVHDDRAEGFMVQTDLGLSGRMADDGDVFEADPDLSGCSPV